MPIQPREIVEALALPVHGGFDHAELESLGVSPDDLVDFSANLNPWGAPPAVQASLPGAHLSRYPDGAAIALRRAIAGRLRVPTEAVIAGNGSSELLWLVAMAYIDAGDRVLVAGPSFGEYERVSALAGAELLVQRARALDDFRHDIRALRQIAEQWRPRVIFLCNPNNPTGHYLDRQSIETLVSVAKGSLLVLDEAYIGFVEQPWSSLDLLDRGVLILRSMTKDYGLAGLRLGYAVGEPAIVAALDKVRPPWNVNAMAQAAGVTCLSDEAHVLAARERLAEARTYLVKGLSALGLRVVPTDTSFFLVDVGDARACRAYLLGDRMLVRDCRSFGLPSFVRIAARGLPDCERLVRAMAGFLAERSPSR